MSSLRIVAAKTETDAQAQKLLLEDAGYRATEPTYYDVVDWRGGSCRGVDDVCRRVWVVQGTK